MLHGVELAERLNPVTVANDQKSRRLGVAAIRRLGSRVENGLEIGIADGLVVPQASNGPLGEHRLTDRHAQSGGHFKISHFHRHSSRLVKGKRGRTIISD